MPKALNSRPGRPRPSMVARVHRSSPRSRGYDSKWDRASKRYRAKVGVCERCIRADRVRVPQVVDHKAPVADGGPMFDRSNWWCLCTACHGWKASLEAYARSTDQIEKLRLWCDNPEELPKKFQELGAADGRGFGP